MADLYLFFKATNLNQCQLSQVVQINTNGRLLVNAWCFSPFVISASPGIHSEFHLSNFQPSTLDPNYEKQGNKKCQTKWNLIGTFWEDALITFKVVRVWWSKRISSFGATPFEKERPLLILKTSIKNGITYSLMACKNDTTVRTCFSYKQKSQQVRLLKKMVTKTDLLRV